MRSRRDFRLIRWRPRPEVPQMILVGPFVRQHLLARCLPRLWRHDRRCVHSEMSLPCPSPLCCHSLSSFVYCWLSLFHAPHGGVLPPFCRQYQTRLGAYGRDGQEWPRDQCFAATRRQQCATMQFPLTACRKCRYWLGTTPATGRCEVNAASTVIAISISQPIDRPQLSI